MIDISARRVISAVATVVAVVVVAAFVVHAVPGVVGADASYVVLSGSMSPTISPGDAVVVNDVDPENIEVDDVITYTRSAESTPVTHRVVEVLDGENGLAFRTQGDANDAPDSQPVPAGSVTGEVWFTIPYIGHVVLFANTPTGFATLVGLPLLAFLATELYSFARGGVSSDTTAAEPVTEPGSASLADGGSTAAGTAVDVAESTDEPLPAASDDALALTAADLKLSAVGFGALAAYSGYVAYLDPTPIHVSVLVGAVVILAFIGAVFVAGRGEETDATTGEFPDALVDPDGPPNASSEAADDDSAAGGDDDEA